MKIKICGLNPARDVQLCIDLKVDFLGFVLYEKSPRNLNLEEIKKLQDYKKKSSLFVAVTVDPSNEFIKKNIPIFGVCNGFQILTKLNLLPGRLELNNDKKFTCKNVRCVLSSSYSENNKDEIIYLQVANSYGNYKVDPNILQKMIENEFKNEWF